MSVDTRLVFRGEKRFLEALAKALRPDNMDTPAYMAMYDRLGEDEYVITITVPLSPRRIMGLRQTLDEILSIASMIERTRVSGNP